TIWPRDWSSDVCSYDLLRKPDQVRRARFAWTARVAPRVGRRSSLDGAAGLSHARIGTARPVHGRRRARAGPIRTTPGGAGERGRAPRERIRHAWVLRLRASAGK